MIFDSNTGQAVGILLPQWSFLPVNKISLPGFLYPVTSVMEEGHLLRFVIIAGKEKESVNCRGKDFFWRNVSNMFLPEYFVIDITGYMKDRIVSFTGITAKDSGLFVKGKKIGEFSEMEDVFHYFDLSESWNILSGKIKPSCGILGSDRIYVPETNVMLGILSRNVHFPKGWDMQDLGRIERLIETCGIKVLPEEISLDEISKKLSRVADVDNLLKEIVQNDKDTILR